MIVCPARKLVFVHIYKTAGSSITDLLMPHTDDRFRVAEPRARGRNYQSDWHYRRAQHAGYGDHAAELAEALPDWRDYSVLTVVRDPLDWLISIYRDFYAPVLHRTQGPRAKFQRWYPERRFGDFMDYVHRRRTHRLPGTVPQSDFLEGVAEDRLIVVRFEQLAEELPATLRGLGIDCPALPHRNRRARDADAVAEWRADPRAAAFCEAQFAADYARFGYSAVSPEPAPAS